MERRSLLIDKLKNEDGQMLPFLAVVLTVMVLFAAWGFARSMVFSQRMRVRDSADAAAHAALSPVQKETRATYFGERKVYVRDSDGKVIGSHWEKYESAEKDRLELSEAEARALAREYFEKNMRLKGVDYKLIAWQFELDWEDRPLQVLKNRLHTEGIRTAWTENFPRWYEAKVTAAVEVPAPMGSLVGRERMTVAVPVTAQTALDGVIPHREGGGGWY